MKRMIRYLCTLMFFVVAATSAAHSYCANSNTIAAGIACCCEVVADCATLQSSCCSVSQSDRAIVPQIDDASTQPPVAAPTSINGVDLVSDNVLPNSKAIDQSYHLASNKLYLKKRSLLI